MSRWTVDDLAQQFERVRQAEWIPLFETAAASIGVPAEMLLAIGSRETNLRNIKGDFYDGSYHGFGIMQVDIGTDPVFCANWTEAKVIESIGRGAEILAGKRAYLVSKSIAVTHQAIAAAYNTGEGNVYRSLKAGADPDRTTSGNDYGRDVLARMQIFGRFLRNLRSGEAHIVDVQPQAA